MPNENDSTTETTEETPEVVEGQEPEGTEETETPEVEEVPAEVLREKLTQANAQAANYRTRLRETEAKLSAAKTPEEFEAARAELTNRVAELEHQIVHQAVVTEFKLPAALAKALTGSTEAELKAHAAELAKLIPGQPAPEQLKGGLTPDSEQGQQTLSPAEIRKATRRR